MLGNFTYYCPTRMYFGDKAQKNLPAALKPFGKKVLLIYGGGSISATVSMKKFLRSLPRQIKR